MFCEKLSFGILFASVLVFSCGINAMQMQVEQQTLAAPPPSLEEVQKKVQVEQSAIRKGCEKCGTCVCLTTCAAAYGCGLVAVAPCLIPCLTCAACTTAGCCACLYCEAYHIDLLQRLADPN